MSTKSALAKEVAEVERSAKTEIAQKSASIKSLKDDVARAKARIVEAHRAAKIMEPLIVLKSAKQVQQFLEDKKVRGFVKNPSACPIASYLKRGAASNTRVSVGGNHIHFGDFVFATPCPLSTFIRRFDGGKIPSLKK